METTIKRGGKRLGAGRKKGLASVKAEEARKYMVDRIAAELEPILSAQIELAKGAYYETEDDQGKRTVYRKLPDPRISTYLLNQLVGRPKETLDMNVTPVFSLKALAAQRHLVKEEDVQRLLEESENENRLRTKTPIKPN